ncbi:macrolide transport system ATP-binding/permease protein [Stackebrandtia endophytica]|uniref:Macrolide transport system ATP-binding/permease protein n=1 Tax=Stackebrandtia endophytica TaxID=1496996 RepID=A0A543B280_9ACTN|nr:ABC-F family ATP-binding cassette domain-containing protein [Stackebrandtia endophytica]TQL78938.1 macrolide transport system ATP-binding/permease protein [Stackebrandtia endophytica]
MNHSVVVSQTTLSDVSKAYDGRRVLDRIDVAVPHGEKVAVVGENGSGKSTLLRLLAGEELPDSGDVTVQAVGGIGHCGQTVDLVAHRFVADLVDDAFADLRRLQSRIAAAEAELADADAEGLAAYGDLLTEFEQLGGYEVDSRVAAAMRGLGVADIALDRGLSTLSGGEQSRLALAVVLAADPELILLDEPTNHLDASAVAWLIARLRDHRGTVVAVTHDRRFLAGFAQSILEVDGDTGGVHRYGTDWRGYLVAKAAERERWEQRYREWCAEVDRQNATVESGAKRLASQIKSDTRPRTAGHRRSHETGLSAVVRNAHERLRRLTENPVPRPPEPLRFAAAFNVGDTTEDSVEVDYELTDVRVADRLEITDLRLKPGARVLVTGPNGAGKSTLLRVLAGQLEPDTGTVVRPDSVGYLPQELPTPAPARTVLAEFAHGRTGEPAEYTDLLRDLGLLAEHDFDKPVAALSVGQRRRLALARLVSRPRRVLLLDEPTNHLSPALMSELERALEEYTGGLVVVSHNAEFNRRFTGDRMTLEEGRLVSLPPSNRSEFHITGETEWSAR